jgi:hypothetical protein
MKHDEKVVSNIEGFFVDGDTCKCFLLGVLVIIIITIITITSSIRVPLNRICMSHLILEAHFFFLVDLLVLILLVIFIILRIICCEIERDYSIWFHV